MSEALEQEIRDLRALFWSDRDPGGRGFAPLADAYRRAGELEEARELLADGLDRHPEFSSGHVVAAWVAREEGDREGVKSSFHRVLELDSENVVALRAMGGICEDEGREEEALSYFRRLQELEPHDPELGRRVDRLSGEASPEEEAVDRAESSAEPEPEVEEEPRADEPSAEDDLEGLDPAEAAADPGAAEEAWDEVSDDGEDEGEVYTATMAEVYVRQGLHERAAGVYEELLAAEPENVFFRERLAEIREMSAGAPRTEETEEEDEEAAPAGTRGESVGSYFEGLLAWVPGAVPVESLAPESDTGVEASSEAPTEVDVQAAPEEEPAPEEDESAVAVESPGPDAVPVATLAPDEAVAREEVADQEVADQESADELELEAVPVGSLAPDPPARKAVEVEQEAVELEEEVEKKVEQEADQVDPDLSDVLDKIDSLGGDEEEEPGEGAGLDDFQKWLDSMGGQ